VAVACLKSFSKFFLYEKSFKTTTQSEWSIMWSRFESPPSQPACSIVSSSTIGRSSCCCMTTYLSYIFCSVCSMFLRGPCDVLFVINFRWYSCRNCLIAHFPCNTSVTLYYVTTLCAPAFNKAVRGKVIVFVRAIVA
jgi:hypothetical protein